MVKQAHTSVGLVKPSRLFDYLYDPSCILSGQADHTRTDDSAHLRFKCVPSWENMFTDLRRFRRMYRQPDTLDHVPPFVPRDWRDYEAVARETLRPCQCIATYNTAFVCHAKGHGLVQQQELYRSIPDVPFGIPYEQVFPGLRTTAGGLSDTLQVNELCGTSPINRKHGATSPCESTLFYGRRKATRATKSVKTQTIFRDSDAQTDPYSPPTKNATRPPASLSELLHLTHFSYGHGLPAGLAEVILIEQARERRAFEATLSPMIDEASIELGRRTFIELETCRWARRVQVILRLKEVKLRAFLQLLREHQLASSKRLNKRMDILWDNLKRDKLDPKVSQIRIDCQRAIRVMMRRAGRFETNTHHKRDIIGEHANLGSQVFAPLTRIGFFPERNCNTNRIDPNLLDTYDGLLELETWLPRCFLKPCIKRPENRQRTKTGHLKSKFLYEKHLGEVYKILNDKRLHPPGPLVESRLKEYRDKMRDRVLTPSVQPSNDDGTEAAVTLLQSLIRGRAVQNTMYDSKEQRIDLIDELKSTHAMWESLRALRQGQKEAVLLAQVEQQHDVHQDNYCAEILEGLNAANLGELLDFTSKELVRLIDEQRLHAMAMLIERQRRVREAEESGVRHTEERRRREEDEIFKNTIKVHENSIDVYLTDVVLAAMEREADEAARLEVQKLAMKIDRIAAELMESAPADGDGRRQATSEQTSVVAELVYGFLIPEVAKQEFRERVHRKQRSSLVAAHYEIFGIAQEILADDALTDKTADFQTPLPAPCNTVSLAELTRIFPDDADNVSKKFTSARGNTH